MGSFFTPGTHNIITSKMQGSPPGRFMQLYFCRVPFSLELWSATSKLLSLPNLLFLNSASPLCSAWDSRPCTVVTSCLQVETRVRLGLILFVPISQEPQPWAASVRCLEIAVSQALSSFLLVYGGKVNLVPMPLLWKETEIQDFFFFKFESSYNISQFTWPYITSCRIPINIFRNDSSLEYILESFALRERIP